MFHRIAIAALLIANLAAQANAQKDKPKTTSLLTWETVAADKAAKMKTQRSQVPGGWLVLVQIDEEINLTFLPDAAHRWSDDGSPSDAKRGKPTSEDAAKAVLDNARLKLLSEQLRAQAERDYINTRRQAGDERRLFDQVEKAKKNRKPKKGDKGDQASDANKEVERQRIAEALGLAAREESQKTKALAEQARAQEAAARQEAAQLKEKVEVIARQLQEQRVETKKLFEHTRANDELARAEAAQAAAELKQLRADLDLAKKEIERLKQFLDKKKK